MRRVFILSSLRKSVSGLLAMSVFVSSVSCGWNRTDHDRSVAASAPREPRPPTSLSLLSPLFNPWFDRSPVVRVKGGEVDSGKVVRLYGSDACDDDSLLGSAVAGNSGMADVLVWPALNHNGQYEFHATVVSDWGLESGCSMVSTSYELLKIWTGLGLRAPASSDEPIRIASVTTDPISLPEAVSETVAEDLTEPHLPRERLFWAEAGFGVLNQDQGSTLSSAERKVHGIGEFSAGVELWEKYEIEGRFRSQVLRLSGKRASPLWIQGNVGRAFELPTFLRFRTRVTPVAGAEFYRSRVSEASQGAIYAAGYLLPILGVRVNFAHPSNWDVHGGFIYALASGGSKSSVRGGLRYWLTPNLACGVGYETDVINASSQSNSLSDQSSSTDFSVRYRF